MLKKSKHQGSIQSLSDDQLRHLRVSCVYRGLDATAAAVLREQVKRIRSSDLVSNAA
jgi:hypothetical protein